jgi:hypothetical protein
MAPWQDEQSSSSLSSSEHERSHILLRKAFEIRTFSDTGGPRKNTGFQLAVLCVTLLFDVNLCSVPSVRKVILWESSHIGSVTRRLCFIGSYFCKTVLPRKRSKDKRHSKYFKLLSLLIFIRAYLLFTITRNAVGLGANLTYFRAKFFAKTKPVTNSRLSFHPISQFHLLMLNQHLAVPKYLHRSSILFVNTFSFRCMSVEPGVSIPEREVFTSGVANWLSVSYFATLSTRKELQRYKLSRVTVSLYFVYSFCSRCFGFSVDSGSREWWTHQGHSRDLGTIFNHSSSVCEGYVCCGQCLYSSNKDRVYSFYNTTQLVRSILSFIYFYISFLLWKGSDQHADTDLVVTARNRGGKNVRTTCGSSSPLCLVMWA